jgi:hypothetical protein
MLNFWGVLRGAQHGLGALELIQMSENIKKSTEFCEEQRFTLFKNISLLNTVILETLKAIQLIKKFPVLFETLTIITTFKGPYPEPDKPNPRITTKNTLPFTF